MIPKSFLQACAALVLFFISIHTVSSMTLRRAASVQISDNMHSLTQEPRRTGWRLNRLRRFAQRLRQLNERYPQQKHNQEDDFYKPEKRNLPKSTLSQKPGDIFKSNFETEANYDYLPLPVSAARPNVAYQKEKETDLTRGPSPRDFLRIPEPVRIRKPVTYYSEPGDFSGVFPDLPRTRQPMYFRGQSTLTEEELMRSSLPRPSFVRPRTSFSIDEAYTGSRGPHELDSDVGESGSGELESAQEEKSGLYDRFDTPEVGPSAKTEVLILTNVDPTAGLDHLGSGHYSKCPPQEDYYCLNGGTCAVIKDLRSRICQCTTGYTGQRCEKPDTDMIIRRLLEMDRSAHRRW